MKPQTFNKPVQEIKPLKKTNKHLKLKAFTILTMTAMIFLFFATFILLAAEFRSTHTFKWQSPVVLRKAVIIKRVEIISPMASRSSMLNPKAYAAEIKNPYDVRSPKGVGWELVKSKWGIQEWTAFDLLITQESGWHVESINSSSGACGLGQALPCSKLGVELWDYEGQLKWIVNYISDRYSNPSKAWEHEQIEGWY